MFFCRKCKKLEYSLLLKTKKCCQRKMVKITDKKTLYELKEKLNKSSS